MANTTNYGWTKPDVGGSDGSWGTTLNQALDAIDGALHTVSAGPGSGLPTSGGTLTGLLNVHTESIARADRGAVGGAVTIDLSAAQYAALTIAGATTLSISNPAAGAVAQGLVLRVVNGGSAAITWPATFRWPGGSPPALTPAGTDLIIAITDDNGTTWRAALAMKDVR